MQNPNDMRNKLLFIITATLIIFILFNLLVKKQANRLFCLRKINVQIANFKKAVFRLGVIHIDEEEKYIDSIKNGLIVQCLKSS